MKRGLMQLYLFRGVSLLANNSEEQQDAAWIVQSGTEDTRRTNRFMEPATLAKT